MTRTSRAARRPRIAVDVVGALGLVGHLLKYLGISALIPIAFALATDEPAWPFAVAGLTISGSGLILSRLSDRSGHVGVREGYLVVALTWLLASVYGALPYILARDPQLGRPVDALFEGMSGFTTTGSSVATDVAALPISIAIWRQLTVWLGGIGVVALGVAILPRLRVGGRQMLQSELAGPDVDGFSVRIRDTVRQFWIAYLGLTAAGFLALALPHWIGRSDAMDSFEAFAHALTTVGTGGFSTEPESIGAFGPLTQWTVVVFMAIAGANLLLLYRSLAQRRPELATTDEEHRLYVGILVAAGALLTLLLIADGPLAGTEALRAAVFEATSVITTTGYFVTDYSTWSTLALMAIALLFFVGGCSGSTAGSIKIVRHLLIGRALRRDLERTVRPELVRVTRLNGAVVDPQVLTAVTSFVLLYAAVFVVGTGLLGLDALASDTGAGALELIFASASSLGNSGVGLGPAGPTGSFGTYGDGSTLTMTALMWLGRLEIIPVLVLLSRRYWCV